MQWARKKKEAEYFHYFSRQIVFNRIVQICSCCFEERQGSETI